MKTYVLAAAALLPFTLIAQEAPPPPPEPTPASEIKPTSAPDAPDTPPDDEIIELSPFEVVESNSGYFAEKGLSSGRLSVDLKDVAANVNVFTKDQLLDLGATDVGGLLDYATSTQVDLGDFDGAGINALNGEGVGRANILGRARGLPTTRLVDYEPVDWEVDNYNVERSDFFLGADAILFGNGSPGGAFNSTRDVANLRKNRARISYRFGSHDESRAILDVNQVLIKGKLALRFEVVDSESGSFRKFFYKDREARYITATFQPFRSTTLRFQYDTGKNARQQPLVDLPADSASAWLDSTNPAKVLAPGSTNASVISGLLTNQNVNTRALFLTSLPNNQANFVPQFYFGGRQAVPTVTPTGFSYASPVAPNNTARVGFLQSAGSNELSTSLYDYNKYSYSGPDARYFQDYSDMRVVFEQKILKDLFLNAYMRKSDSEQNSRFIRRNGPNPTLFADPYSTGPDDPYTGRIYTWANWRYQTADDERTAYVARLAWAPNFGAFGNHQISVGYENRKDISTSLHYQERVYTANPNGQGVISRDLRRINYFDPNDDGTWHLGFWNPIAPFTYADPITGASQVHNVGFLPIGNADFRNSGRNEFRRESYIGYIQSRWWQNRLVTTVGYREDKNEEDAYDPLYLPPGISVPAGVSNVSLTEYNGFAFREDNDTSQRSASYSAVLHLDRGQNYSLFYGEAGNVGYKIAGRVLPDGERQADPAKATSQEYGVRMSFFDDKVSLRLGAFKTTQENSFQNFNNAFWYLFTRAGGTINNPPEFEIFIPSSAGLSIESYNGGYYALDEMVDLMSANNVIDAEKRALYDRILARSPDGITGNNQGVSTMINEGGAEGYEARLNLKPTSNISLILNYSYNKLFRKDVGSDVDDWLEEFFANVNLLPDSVLDASYGDPTVARPTRVNASGAIANVAPFSGSGTNRPAGANPYTRRQVYYGTYFELRDRLDDTIEERSAGFGNRKHKFNAFGRYDFKSGFLKGFTLGGGYTYQSGAIIARVRELDSDGNVVSRNITGDEIWNAKAFASYSFRQRLFGAPRTVRVQLNVENLFNDDYDRDVLRVRTAVNGIGPQGQPLSGLVLNSDGNTIPTRWNYAEPREYFCTVSIDL